MQTKVGALFFEIQAKISENFKTNIKKTETYVKDLILKMKEGEKEVDGFGKQLNKVGKILGIGFLADRLFAFGKASVQAFSNAQQSLLQFNNAQQNVAGTTKEQIEDLNEYILLLEKKTTIDDKSIRQAAQIYAQDQLSIENQKKLLKGTIDLAVANSKSNGGEIDVSGTAKALGLAITTGELGRLTKQNIAGITETQKAIFRTGTDAERTAILMKVLDDNAKGAGEALGKSFQGQINRAKDTLEDLQVALGEGLTIGFSNLVSNLVDTQKEVGVTTTMSENMGIGFIFLSGIITSVIATFKLLFSVFKAGITTIGAVAGIGIGFIVDRFRQLKDTIVAVGSSLSLLAQGKFKEAKESFKDAFKTAFTFDFKSTKLAIDAVSIAYEKQGKEINNNIALLKKGGESITQSKELYKGLKKDLDSTTIAKSNLNQATAREIDAQNDANEATDEAKKKLAEFNKEIVNAREESIKTSKALKEDLADSFKEFGESLVSNTKETQDNLAKIVVDAETKKQALLDKINAGGDNVADAQKELVEVQKILDARVGYEERQAKVIEDIRKRITEAGLDPQTLNLDNLSTTSLEKQIQQERINATLDEFTLFENTQNAKLLKLTEDFIYEASLIQKKIETQTNYEAELTTFLIDETAKRKEDFEQFATFQIQKYGEIANSLRQVIALQAQASLSASSTSSLPQFSKGGYVGSQGGEVHAGEFVIPRELVLANPALVSMLDRARNQTNNITINQNQAQGGDMTSATNELLWRLGKI